MKKAFFIVFFLIISFSIFADQTATTEDGREVLLKDDGTWEYIEKEEEQLEGWTYTPYGSIKIERFWEETLGSYNATYTMVSFINSTKRTFDEIVTIRATIFDGNKNMIDTNTRSFFGYEYGKMEPGFEGIVKIPIECAKGQAQTVSVRIDVAR